MRVTSYLASLIWITFGPVIRVARNPHGWNYGAPQGVVALIVILYFVLLLKVDRDLSSVNSFFTLARIFFREE